MYTRILSVFFAVMMLSALAFVSPIQAQTQPAPLTKDDVEIYIKLLPILLDQIEKGQGIDQKQNDKFLKDNNLTEERMNFIANRVPIATYSALNPDFIKIISEQDPSNAPTEDELKLIEPYKDKIQELMTKIQEAGTKAQ